MNMEKQFELKKHVNAIHCSNNLTLIQRKLFNALLFNAYHNLPHNNRFTIAVRDLCDLIGYNSNDSAKLKMALLDLITISIEWNVIDCATGIEKKWKASSILASAEISRGNCIYEYSYVMKELLFQPEIYGRINMRMVSKFKSTYGLALYENCIRYQGLPQTPWFSVEIFRILMGVFADKYTSFNDFKKRVLNIAVLEVNEISSLNIVPEIERKNQKVTRIRFKLNNKELTNKVDGDLVGDSLISVLKETFSMSQHSIDYVLLHYELAYIQQKIDMILISDSFISGNIRGLSGYLIDSLKKDYKPGKSSKTIVDRNAKNKQTHVVNKEKQEEELRVYYEKYVSGKINAYINALPDNLAQELRDEFEIYIKTSKNFFLDKCYKRNGLDHPAIKGEFKLFIQKKRAQELGKIMSYADFAELNKASECNLNVEDGTFAGC